MATKCGRRARVAKAVAQAAMQPGATQCAIVAGRAAVDADALILALAEAARGDTAATARVQILRRIDGELARGVALCRQQVHHYLSPANQVADDEYECRLPSSRHSSPACAAPGGDGMILAALAAFPNLAAMGADVASLARVVATSRLVELDPTGIFDSAEGRARARPR